MKKLVFILIAIILIFISLEFSLTIIKDFSTLKQNRKIVLNQIEKFPEFYVKGTDYLDQFLKEKEASKFEYKSYVGWRRLPFKGKTLNIDNTGVRKTVQKNLPNDSLPIVVFLGGSTMWGMGSADHHTIPSQFAGKINGRCKVYNYGESGYNAYQSLQYLQLKIINGFKPSIVITYDGTNNTPVRGDYFAHAREVQIQNQLKDIDNNKFTQIRSFRTLRETLGLLRINSEINVNKEYDRVDRNRLAAIELLETWLLMKEKADKIDASFICILQPNVFVGEPSVKYLGKILKESPYRLGYEYYGDVYELLELEKYQPLKNHFLDFTNIFNIDSAVYIDFCHVTPYGNEIVAEKLLEYFDNNELLE